MVVTSSVPAFLDNLQTQLLARPGLTGVDIYTGLVGDNLGKDSIQLLTIPTHTANWGLIGQRRIEEDYSIDGIITGHSRLKGEDGIKAARDRAYAIFDELLEQLRSDPTANGAVRLSSVSGAPLDQGYTTEWRVARIDVQITVSAWLVA